MAEPNPSVAVDPSAESNVQSTDTTAAPPRASQEKKELADADEKHATAAAPASAEAAAIDKETGGGAAPRASSQADSADDSVNPSDFQGEVLSNDELPSAETIQRIGEYTVLDRYGKAHQFKSLYTGRNVARRVLIIFVRHFYCGNCQEYLRTLSASIKADSLLHLPISTFIAVIGCGDPAIIDMYAEATGCPYPIYADPTRKLYAELGMIRTLALGPRPAYASKSLLKSSLESIVQGVKQIRSGLAIRGGDQRQVGGEFLFEPVDVQSPDASPVQEFDRRLRLGDGDGAKPAAGQDGNGAEVQEGQQQKTEQQQQQQEGGKHSRTTSVTDNDNDEVEDTRLVETKKVTWCHRMRTTRDHVEIPELMEVLGLNGQGQPIKDQKRWSKALEERKGKGQSLAKRMSLMAQQKSVLPEDS